MTELTSSFSTRQVPWLKIGTIIDDESVDAAEAARLGGIDFDVELRSAAYWRPRVDENGNDDGEWVEEPTRRAVVRTDTDEWFSYVSTDYRVVQFHEAFTFMDNVNPRYVAAGALKHGHQGFMIVQLPEHLSVDVVVDGQHDPHDMYVVLQTSHDLSKSLKISVMMLRGKCMNMLTLPSFTANAPQSWSIRHVGDPHAQLEEAHKTLTRASNYREAFERVTVQLGSVRVTSDDLRHIARRILPDRPKRDDQVNAIVNRFETAETVGFRDTGWGAVNAVSDYLQWGRQTAVRTDQSEFTSGLDGDTAKYVRRTAELVMARA
jgi:phage/plasmid-like protein (TIGR03299 family)